MRYERKYRVENSSLAEIMSWVREHPLSFRTLHPDRQVNNVYLDTPQLKFYLENLNGVGERRKYRIRWYGTEVRQGADPALEVKKKLNELGSKDVTKIAESVPVANLPALRAFIRKHCFTAEFLEPVLLNTYERSYLQSYDGKFRLTVDRKMQFYSMEFPLTNRPHFLTDPAIVVEVKYEADLDKEWGRFAQHFPFRVHKNSKYVNGVVLTLDP